MQTVRKKTNNITLRKKTRNQIKLLKRSKQGFKIALIHTVKKKEIASFKNCIKKETNFIERKQI